MPLSPEFIYAIGPGDRMPDDRRFGVIWMPEQALASAYGLQGAFSSVTLKLMRDASEIQVISQLDDLLERYGGGTAYGRKDQTSHAWLDHELDMLSNMSRTLPPIFLLVSAFLVNLTLSRLVALEREEIGLLKAIGYGNTTIATSTSTTAGDGWALFSRNARNNPRATHTITVRSPAKTASTYDPAANTATSTTFTLQ
jgi:putative ABC transport system permease protein